MGEAKKTDLNAQYYLINGFIQLITFSLSFLLNWLQDGGQQSYCSSLIESSVYVVQTSHFHQVERITSGIKLCTLMFAECFDKVWNVAVALQVIQYDLNETENDRWFTTTAEWWNILELF